MCFCRYTQNKKKASLPEENAQSLNISNLLICKINYHSKEGLGPAEHSANYIYPIYLLPFPCTHVPFYNAVHTKLQYFVQPESGKSPHLVAVNISGYTVTIILVVEKAKKQSTNLYMGSSIHIENCWKFLARLHH